MARQQRSEYMDRLRHADRLDSWQPDDLEAALSYLDELDAARAEPHWRPHAIDIRLAIYRGRLRRELHRRSGQGGGITGMLG